MQLESIFPKMDNFYVLEILREGPFFGIGKHVKITELYKHMMEFVLISNGTLSNNQKLRLVDGMDLLNIGIEYNKYLF